MNIRDEFVSFVLNLTPEQLEKVLARLPEALLEAAELERSLQANE